MEQPLHPYYLNIHLPLYVVEGIKVSDVCFVLRTGLEPVSFPVKGGCPNQLDERSVLI